MPRRVRRSYRKRNALSKRVRKAVKQIAYSTQETKHHRVNTVATALPDSSFWVELNSVDSQGDASGEFIGQEIRQIGIRLKGYMKQADNSNLVRMLIFQPSPSQLQNYAAGNPLDQNLFYTGDPLIQPVRESSVTRVFLDRLIVLNQTTGQNDKLYLFNHWVNLKMKKYTIVETSLPPNPPPIVGQDLIYVLFQSDSAFASHPTLDMMSILYYKDA